MFYGPRHFSARIDTGSVDDIKKIGTWLQTKPLDLIMTSEYLRCRETAEIITEIINKEYTLDNRLNSIFFETPWQVKKRVVRFLEDRERSEQNHIAICTHGYIIAVLQSLLLNKKLTLIDTFKQIQPGVLLVLSRGKMEIRIFGKSNEMNN